MIQGQRPRSVVEPPRRDLPSRQNIVCPRAETSACYVDFPPRMIRSARHVFCAATRFRRRHPFHPRDRRMSVTVCVQCSLRALLERKPVPSFEGPPRRMRRACIPTRTRATTSIGRSSRWSGRLTTHAGGRLSGGWGSRASGGGGAARCGCVAARAATAPHALSRTGACAPRPHHRRGAERRRADPAQSARLRSGSGRHALLRRAGASRRRVQRHIHRALVGSWRDTEGVRPADSEGGRSDPEGGRLLAGRWRGSIVKATPAARAIGEPRAEGEG